MDTARLVTAFGTHDTVQFFEGQRFSKSVFLMRYRGPPDLTDPQIFFTYDLRLNNVIQETKYTCAFIPLPMVKQKHHIYKVNLQAVLLGEKTGQERLVPSIMCTSLSFTAF
ncbi:MOXD2 protein, partial [Caloenas nicobarica]|nr:MOXD2 protein [Caloenas nicobarica]